MDGAAGSGRQGKGRGHVHCVKCSQDLEKKSIWTNMRFFVFFLIERNRTTSVNKSSLCSYLNTAIARHLKHLHLQQTMMVIKVGGADFNVHSVTHAGTTM